jgi:hypothetical protein
LSFRSIAGAQFVGLISLSGGAPAPLSIHSNLFVSGSERLFGYHYIDPVRFSRLFFPLF